MNCSPELLKPLRTREQVIAELREREALARLDVWRLEIEGKFNTPEYRNAHKRWTDAWAVEIRLKARQLSGVGKPGERVEGPHPLRTIIIEALAFGVDEMETRHDL